MIGLAAAAITSFVLLVRNATMLFVAEVRDGRIIRARGRLPPGLARDLEDVAGLRPVRNARLRAVVSDRRPLLRVSGDVREHELQRMRNVLGTWQLARIRAARYRSK